MTTFELFPESLPMSSPAASPANPPAFPASGADRPTSAGYGLRSSKLFDHLAPAGSWQKILAASLAWNLTASSGFAGSFMTQVTMSGRRLFPLSTWVRHTSDHECGLLPTPAATSYGTTNNGRRGDGSTYRTAGTPSLQTMASRNLWPTPQGYGKGTSASTPGLTPLDIAVRPEMAHHGERAKQRKRGLFPTPMAREGRGDFLNGGSHSRQAAKDRGLWPTPTSTLGTNGGRVQPRKSKEGGNLIEAVSARTVWPTPTAGDAKSSGSRNTPNSKAHPGVSLTDAVREDGGQGRLWPTPAARDYRHPNARPYSARGGGTKGEQLNNAVIHRFPTPTAPGLKQVGTIAEWGGHNNPLRTPETMTLAGGALNPEFVEWLMGFPKGWTEV